MQRRFSYFDTSSYEEIFTIKFCIFGAQFFTEYRIISNNYSSYSVSYYRVRGFFSEFLTDTLFYRKVIFPCKLEVPLIMRWHRHDSTCTIRTKDIICDPEWYCFTIIGVYYIRACKYSGFFFPIIRTILIRLPFCISYISITYGSIFVRYEVSYTWMIWSEDSISHTIHRIHTSRIDADRWDDRFEERIELCISIGGDEVA